MALGLQGPGGRVLLPPPSSSRPFDTPSSEGSQPSGLGSRGVQGPAWPIPSRPPGPCKGAPGGPPEPWASSLGVPRALLGTPPLRAGVPMGPGSCGAYFLTPLEDPQGLRVGGIPTLKDSPFNDPPPVNNPLSILLHQ